MAAFIHKSYLHIPLSFPENILSSAIVENSKSSVKWKVVNNEMHVLKLKK